MHINGAFLLSVIPALVLYLRLRTFFRLGFLQSLIWAVIIGGGQFLLFKLPFMAAIGAHNAIFP